MAVHEITKRDGEYWAGMHILMVQYPEGDCDTPQTWHDLYIACYDHHQMFESWQDEDILKFRDIEFARISSYHVIPIQNAAFTTRDTMDHPLPD